MTILNGIFAGKTGTILFGDPTLTPIKSPCFIMISNEGPSDISASYSTPNGNQNSQIVKVGNSGFFGVAEKFLLNWWSMDENGTAKGTWQIAFSGKDESGS